MKNSIYTLLLSSIVIFGTCSDVNAQSIWWLNFDDTQTNNERIIIDTTGGNSWQIGSPGKSNFTAAQSAPNVIVTDTLNPYPSNDTSSFIIKHAADLGWQTMYPGISIEGWYSVDSDSLNDFGFIEFSHDYGSTWYNLDSAGNYGCCFAGADILPTFTGSSNGWQYFKYCICTPVTVNNGDTIYYRFTFISDSVNTNKDGLMFDDLMFEDFMEGIEELNKGEVELVKVIDSMGKNTEDKPNTLLIYIYSDGTTEKVFRIE